ncbi:MAG: class I SAM-dependent methyltransferase [Anaerolineales bacterium]|nr:class I SAM-dependent methyltransferase [Anaerolineales bacterium]
MSRLLNLEVVPARPCDVDFAWYEDIRADLLRRTIKHMGRVLDVGCGRGGVLLMLSGQIGEGIGIDINQGDLHRAETERKQRKITNVMFQHADAIVLPFPSDSFDAVLLLGDVLAYPSTYGKHGSVVSELRRVLKEEGVAVHESMNWDWEYRWPYPPSDISFTRSGMNNFTMHRIRRNVSGLETAQDYVVLPETPLYQWILEQDWPVSPQGANIQLEVREYTPIPEEWLKLCGVSQYKHYRAQDLTRLYKSAGFHHPEVFAYGQTYDIAAKAGLLDQVAVFQSELATAEAEVAFTLRLGSGPWLFLVAEK